MKISKLRPSRVSFIFKFEVSVSFYIVQFQGRRAEEDEGLHRKIAFQRVDRLDNVTLNEHIGQVSGSFVSIIHGAAEDFSSFLFSCKSHVILPLWEHLADYSHDSFPP